MLFTHTRRAHCLHTHTHVYDSRNRLHAFACDTHWRIPFHLRDGRVLGTSAISTRIIASVRRAALAGPAATCAENTSYRIVARWRFFGIFSHCGCGCTTRMRYWHFRVYMFIECRPLIADTTATAELETNLPRCVRTST